MQIRALAQIKYVNQGYLVSKFFVQASPVWTLSPHCKVEINLLSAMWTSCTTGEMKHLLYTVRSMHYKLKTNDFFFEKKINTMQATKHMYTVYHVKEVPVTSHWPRVLGVQIAYM